MGLLTVLIGISIIGWYVFNLAFPTRDFQRSPLGIVQLVVPLLMVRLGWRWFTAPTRNEQRQFPHFIFARVTDALETRERTRKYADPLHRSLVERECGRVSGGGSDVGKDGLVKSFGIDIELADLDESLDFTRDRLRELGAPAGSVLEYREKGKIVTVPIV